MYILCCSISKWSVMFAGYTSYSGLCFAEVLINFRFGKFQALDMSCFSKGHAGIFREFWHDLCQNM